MSYFSFVKNLTLFKWIIYHTSCLLGFKSSIKSVKCRLAFFFLFAFSLEKRKYFYSALKYV